jgi:hypothetical protein
MPLLVVLAVGGCDVEGVEPASGDGGVEIEPGGFACGDIRCAAGEVCVFFDTRVQVQLDAGTQGLFACRVDPCRPQPLSCTCALTPICGGVGATCDLAGRTLTCRNTP